MAFPMPVLQQCRLLAVSSSIYRQPPAVSEEERTIMALIDRRYLARPLLRFAPDDGVAGHPRPCRQSQTRAASDAAHGAGGDLPATEREQGSRRAQSLPVSARRHHDRAG